eukprot:215461_1
MQAHVRHVEKFTNFMSPVGLSISHYNTSHPRKRQTFSSLSHPPNVTSNLSNGSGSDSEPQQSVPSTPPTHHHPAATSTTVAPHAMQQNISENQWTRHNLSLRHSRNRAMYHESNSNEDESSTNEILDKLIIYGYETSADIAKMQPWQLRVLKKEIPQIDFIFMTAYRMWGKQEYYDDTQNLTFRQYWDPAVWLQYNEIELIIKCFDMKQRGYQCMICGVRHGLSELDVVRWHIWLEHKNSTQLNAIMQSSKKHNDHNFTKPLQHLQLPPLETHTTKPKQIISLLDSTDDEMDTQTSRKSTRNYNTKARSYNSRRHRVRRSKRIKLMNRKDKDTTIIAPKTVQNPIIINGCDDDPYDYAANDELHRMHDSQSPTFIMPSAQQSVRMNDAVDRSTTNTMECDDSFMDNTMHCDEDQFNMIGFNDDFSTLGVMGALSRNSSDNSFNGELQLNSAFADPAQFTSFKPKEIRIDSMNEMI